MDVPEFVNWKLSEKEPFDNFPTTFRSFCTLTPFFPKLDPLSIPLYSPLPKRRQHVLEFRSNFVLLVLHTLLIKVLLFFWLSSGLCSGPQSFDSESGLGRGLGRIKTFISK